MKSWRHLAGARERTVSEVTIWVSGDPAPKGSMHGFPIKRIKNGQERTGVVLTHSARSKHWETLIRDQRPPGVFLDGPLEIEVWYYLQRPGTVKRRWPWVAPDLDKLNRAVWDALKGLIEDDSRIVDSHSHKRYAENGEIGAQITIRQKDENAD